VAGNSNVGGLIFTASGSKVKIPVFLNPDIILVTVNEFW
jgi:hypothetical protein